ncbi:FMN-binding negative transcriptional regulator [Streptomyces incarnatus]
MIVVRGPPQTLIYAGPAVRPPPSPGTPVWKAVEHDPNVTFDVSGDYAFIPGTWRAAPGVPPTDGVPTSYYAAVQFTCRARVIDGPEAKAELLRRQLAHFQPDGDHGPRRGRPAALRPDAAGHPRLELDVVEVRAKFKYDNQKPVELRTTVADRLIETRRGPRCAYGPPAAAPRGPRRNLEGPTPAT